MSGVGRDLSGGFSSWFATLYVPGCVFVAPEGMYSKCIELTFDVYVCSMERTPTWNPALGGYERKAVYKTVQQIICVPVSLRPVSDISIG